MVKSHFVACIRTLRSDNSKELELTDFQQKWRNLLQFSCVERREQNFVVECKHQDILKFGFLWLLFSSIWLILLLFLCFFCLIDSRPTYSSVWLILCLIACLCWFFCLIAYLFIDSSEWLFLSLVICSFVWLIFFFLYISSSLWPPSFLLFGCYSPLARPFGCLSMMLIQFFSMMVHISNRSFFFGCSSLMISLLRVIHFGCSSLLIMILVGLVYFKGLFCNKLKTYSKL